MDMGFAKYLTIDLKVGWIRVKALQERLNDSKLFYKLSLYIVPM